ncbi:hypothetical protein EYF80_066052 [Liparis tanakae]|uniref:Uncharacterized protein n=1 Tax=Liparis tanakae TaxID=230148 RepID=A0A4Z2E4I5_9TELE|nr:hypothetical protein EYF80_066052 [Liparis tanakae]
MTSTILCAPRGRGGTEDRNGELGYRAQERESLGGQVQEEGALGVWGQATRHRVLEPDGTGHEEPGKGEPATGQTEAGQGESGPYKREMEPAGTTAEHREPGQGELEAGQRELEAGQGELEAGQRELEAGQGELEAGEGGAGDGTDRSRTGGTTAGWDGDGGGRPGKGRDEDETEGTSGARGNRTDQGGNGTSMGYWERGPVGTARRQREPSWAAMVERPMAGRTAAGSWDDRLAESRAAWAGRRTGCRAAGAWRRQLEPTGTATRGRDLVACPPLQPPRSAGHG